MHLRSLWPSSYALFSGGVATLALGVLHRRLDLGRSSPWRDRLSEPLVALGRNALLLFVLSGLAAPKPASLLYAAANLTALYVLLAWLHRRRWHWSV